MYAVVDIETTGGSPQFSRITEIAIYVHDGLKVVGEYATLVNPEIPIPPFISRLTGITDEMVADAPKFHEIAQNVLEITEDAVFVAHNAQFDYHFLREEFTRLGYPFFRQTLCTVRLSRRLLPNLKSHGLGNLCKSLGIVITNRHRAGGDALATVQLLEHLMSLNKQDIFSDLLTKDVLPSRINQYLNRSKVEGLPEDTGIYYFFNHKGEVIFIGKSRNIRKRVFAHLNNEKQVKAKKLKEEIADIDFALTGSELVAMLFEANELRKHQPSFNPRKKQLITGYGVNAFYWIDGFVHFEIKKVSPKSDPLVVCGSEDEARAMLMKLIREHGLCLQKGGLEPETRNKPCLYHKIGTCTGACNGTESVDAYNQRAMEALSTLKFKHPDFLIIDRGRNPGEKSVIKVENGRYKGFGFAENELIDQNVEILKDCTRHHKDSAEINRIIRSFVSRQQIEHIITY